MAIDIDPGLSPYLQGNFAPVHDELDVADLEVTGRIPDALTGAYLATGPTRPSRRSAATTSSTATE